MFFIHNKFQHSRRFAGSIALIVMTLMLSASHLFADDDIDVEGSIEAIGTEHLQVAGIEFLVDGETEIRGPDGADLMLGDLVVGLYVSVEGEALVDTSYLATRIELDDELELEGQIDTLGSNYLVVHGTTIFVDENTDIEGPDGNPLPFSQLQQGDFVEVEAILQNDDSYLAESIEVEGEDEDIEVEGQISALSGNSLTVNAIEFFVNSSTEIRDDDDNLIDFSQLSVGLLVEIDAVLQADSSFLATHIEVEDAEDDDEIELTAPIDSIYNDTLVVSGLTFLTDDNTEVFGDDDQPLSFADLEAGMIVEIEGRIIPDNGIYAEEIEVEDFFQDELEITGIIDSLGGDWISVLGIRFSVNENTLVFDDENQSINFSDLIAGMEVEVYAEPQADGSWLAVRIELEDDQEDLEFTAIIDSIATNSLHAAGLIFYVNENTQVLDHGNNPISFADLSTGMLVEIKAVLQSSGEYLALRIKLEDSGNFLVTSGVLLSVSGTSVSIDGQIFALQPNTVVLDNQFQPVNSNALAVGQNAKLWGDVANGNQLTALQIKINSPLSPTAIGEKPTPFLPTNYQLEANYPNPFNPSTTIPLSISGITRWQQVELTVYNVLGSKVRTVFQGFLDNGSYRFSWDGTNDQQQMVSSGIYLYQLKVDGVVLQARRMLLIK